MAGVLEDAFYASSVNEDASTVVGVVRSQIRTSNHGSKTQNLSLLLTAMRTRTKHVEVVGSDITAGWNFVRVIFSFQEGEDKAFRCIHLLGETCRLWEERAGRNHDLFSRIEVLTCRTASQCQLLLSFISSNFP